MTAQPVFFAISLAALAVSLITMLAGPRRWVLISVVTAFLSGLFAGIAAAPNLAGVEGGSLVGVLVAMLTLTGGLSARYWRERALREQRSHRPTDESSLRT
jgi:hypothetical protein